MTKIQQLFETKGMQVWSISPDQTVYAALRLMAKRDVGALLVIEGETLVGILSERDYARRVILQGKASMSTRVSEIMTAGVIAITPERTVEEAMALMTERHIRHLPVVEEGRLVGVISLRDLMKVDADAKAEAINMLNYYVGYSPE